MLQKSRKDLDFFLSHFLASSRLPEPSSVDETTGSGNSLRALRGTKNCGDKSRGASDDERCTTPLRNMQEGVMDSDSHGDNVWE